MIFKKSNQKKLDEAIKQISLLGKDQSDKNTERFIAFFCEFISWEYDWDTYDNEFRLKLFNHFGISPTYWKGAQVVETKIGDGMARIKRVKNGSRETIEFQLF